MPKGQYRGVSIAKELLDRIDKFIEENPNQGYSSLADFVTDSCRRRLEDLGVVPPMLSVMDINVEEGGNQVLLWDTKLKRSIAVKFTENEIKCQDCDSDTCYHVEYALSLTKVQQEFERRKKLGLKVPDVKFP